MGVTVFILNYKTYAKTKKCINSVIECRSVDNIVVVDNARENEAFSEMKRDYKNEEKISFISTGENIGYARGNNYGIKSAEKNELLSKYIAIINSDIEVKDDSTIDVLIEAIEGSEKAGVVSPKIRHRATGQIQGPYKRETLSYLMFETIFFPLIPLRKKFEQIWRESLGDIIPVYRTMGSFLLIKTSIFRSIGWFDPKTFLGSEEDIIAEKLREIGLGYFYVPGVEVVHDHGASTSLHNQRKVEQFFYESEVYYYCNYRKFGLLRLSILKWVLKARIFLRKITC